MEKLHLKKQCVHGLVANDAVRPLRDQGHLPVGPVDPLVERGRSDDTAVHVHLRGAVVGGGITVAVVRGAHGRIVGHTALPHQGEPATDRSGELTREPSGGSVLRVMAML